MNREFIFADVIARAKECFGCASDKALAAKLGMTPQTFGNRKNTESIPYGELLAVALAEGADMQYILTGVRTAIAGRFDDAPKGQAPAEAVSTLTPTRRKILELMEGLDEEGEREIQEAVQKEKRRAQDRRELGELKSRASRAKHAA